MEVETSYYQQLLEQYLKKAVDDGASDLFIIAGGKVSYKVDGAIQDLSEEKVFPDQTKELIQALYAMAGRDMRKYQTDGDDDFSFAKAGLARFRVNAFRQRGSLAAVIRIVQFDIPDYRDLQIPEEVMKIAKEQHGMVIISGTAGSGKSTTQACIIDKINQERAAHVITLEDPIEYLHRNNKSLISQREIALDTHDYLSALRACLRQAPDVIQLGEIDTFPSQQQEQIRTQLAAVLITVVSQQLVPDINGKMTPVFEIMHVNSAIKNMIRDNKSYQIDNAIQTSAAEGMISMDQSLITLFQNGKITADTAVEYAVNPDQVARKIKGRG